MLDLFLYAFRAVAPIIMLISLGYILKLRGILTEEFLNAGDKLCFKVALPVLLFVNVYNSEGLRAISWGVVAYMIVALFGSFLLSIGISWFFIKDNKQRGAVFQCGFHANFVSIGFPLATALGGLEASALAAVVAIFSTIIFNAFSVIGLTIAGSASENDKIEVVKTVKKIVCNPLIIGSLFGLLALIIRCLIPLNENGELLFQLSRDCPSLFKVLEYIAKMASPLILLIIGGQFTFSSTGGMLRQIIIGTASRLMIMPLVGIGVACLLSGCIADFNIGNVEYSVMVALFATPVAVTSALLAKQMGCDGKLAVQLAVWTNLFSIVTIFMVIIVMKVGGLL